MVLPRPRQAIPEPSQVEGAGSAKASSQHTFTIEPKSAIALSVDFSYQTSDSKVLVTGIHPSDKVISIPDGVVQLSVTNRVLAEGGDVELRMGADRTRCVTEAFLAFLEKFKEVLNIRDVKCVSKRHGEEEAILQLILATSLSDQSVPPPLVPADMAERNEDLTQPSSLESINVTLTWIEQPTFETSSSVFVWDLATLVQQNPLSYHLHNLLSRCLPRLIREALLLPSFLRSHFCGDWIQRRKSCLQYIESISSSIANLTQRCNQQQGLAENWIRDVSTRLRSTSTHSGDADKLSLMIKEAMLHVDDFVFNPTSMRPKLEQPPFPASRTIDDSDLEDLVREPFFESDDEGEEQKRFRLKLEQSPTPCSELLPCASQWGWHHQDVNTNRVISTELNVEDLSREQQDSGTMEVMEILSFPTSEDNLEYEDKIEVGQHRRLYGEDAGSGSPPFEILSFPDSPTLKSDLVLHQGVYEEEPEPYERPTPDGDGHSDTMTPRPKRIRLNEGLEDALILLFDDEVTEAVAWR